MEADWEIEIGPAAPVIDFDWPGRIDLEREPWRVAELVETFNFPPLAECLATLNSGGSQVFTSKCDVWLLGAEELTDPDEYDARPEEAVAGTACYIDLVQKKMQGSEATGCPIRDEDRFVAHLNDTQGWATRLVRLLRQSNLRCARVDLILRSCSTGGAQSDSRGDPTVAITAYISACGSEAQSSAANLGLALTAFAAAFHKAASDPASGASA